jgi:hypothetical protein
MSGPPTRGRWGPGVPSSVPCWREDTALVAGRRNPNWRLETVHKSSPNPGETVSLLLVPILPRVPSTPSPVCSSTPRVAAVPPVPGARRGRGAEGVGAGERLAGWTARHSPMRLKLSDKVLRNFFILPIFSAGCGSMRSHIWATRGPGNFPKLVQSRAQTTARARGAGKAAPPARAPAPPGPGGDA